MVAPNVRQFGDKPVLCLARPMLYAALECLERCDYVGAGVRLREAVTRFVRSACDYYGCKPKAKYLRPCDYIRALRKAKHLDAWGEELLLEMVTTGNRAAHLESVDRATIKGGIGVLFSIMDGEPYCPHERNPKPATYDDGYSEFDDDNDPADWWKRDEEGGAE